MSKFYIQPSLNLSGELIVDSDKSISHRSIILSSIANGISHIDNFLFSDDCLCTINVFKEMGVNISIENNKVIINGVGLYGLKKAKNNLYFGNSGTSIRLILGVLVAQKFNTILTGDNSLSKRPMQRVIKPLENMGAKIESNDGKIPVKVYKTNSIKNISYKMPVSSAQLKSCLLLASLYADGTTNIIEKEPTRNHTETMLVHYGIDVIKKNNTISINGGDKLKGSNIKIPCDISSAAFFMVAACISKNSNIRLLDVNINPTRDGIIHILSMLGANIKLLNKKFLQMEQVADIEVTYSNLQGCVIPSKLVPRAIDEFPVLFIAASFASGTTIFKGLEELRVKESDRLQAMLLGLKQFGIMAEIRDNDFIVVGDRHKKPQQIVESYGDHRIAMAFAILSCAVNFDFYINDCHFIKTSFPNFKYLANKIGFNIKEIDI